MWDHDVQVQEMVDPANALGSLEGFPWNIFGTCDKAAAHPLGALIFFFFLL